MPSEKIIQLHQALAERGFAVRSLAEIEKEETLVDIPVLQGGLIQGELVELSTEGSSGGGLIIREIVHALAIRGLFLALVDGTDCFDPGSFDPALLARMLWVRTHAVGQAIKAADLLLRDGNLPLVVLQLRGVTLSELRRVPSQHWYRLQHLAKQTGTTCLVVTPQPLVPCARKRWLLDGCFELNDLECDAEEVLPRLRAQLQWRHGGKRHVETAHVG
ncbi:hypothetical protein ACXR0O_00120 [Verrucomicrobiota bacterium sgz303538]